MKIPAILFLLLLSFPVFAQLDGNPANWCRNGAFPRESGNFRLGKVKAEKSERIYFYGDDENCPNGKNCRKKSYLIGGDEVIISRTYEKFACTWFHAEKGETVGWIPLDKLEFSPIVQNTDNFAGKWNFYDNEIVIAKTKEPKIFQVTGNAFWKGLGDNIHIGELDGQAIWNEASLNYGADETDEYACKVTMRLIGKYLIASDNLNCGGANVSFSGVYIKK